MTTFTLVHIGEDYIGVNWKRGKEKEYLELPLIVAEMFLSHLKIDERDIDVPELKKYIKNDFNH